MANDDSLARQLSEIFNETVGVETLHEQHQHGAELTVCEMSYRPTPDHRRIRQTAVVLDAHELNLPQFAQDPKMKGIMGIISARVGGFGGIDFADSPAFSKSYRLHGWNEQPVRVLYTKAIRDYFASQPGWSVRGNGSHLVIFRYNKTCNACAMDDFVRTSLKILSLFREGEQQLDTRPEIRRETRPEDVAATAARMGGRVGGMIERHLRNVSVTRQELDAFLHEAPPRRIPPGLKLHVLGNSFALIIVGVVLFAGGLIVGPFVLVHFRGIVRWIALPNLILSPIVGGLIVGLTMRFRRRKTRVLRQGILADSTVTDVSRTSYKKSNQARYHVTVAYSIDGQERTATCNAYGLAAEEARRRASSGEKTRVLVDRADPDHAVCVDLVTILE